MEEFEKGVRPALDDLNDRQMVLLEEFVGGFEERDRFLDWAIELIAHTFGEASHDLYRRFYKESSTRKMMFGETDAPDADEEVGRRLIALDHVVPAFRSAYKSTRWQSREYVGPESPEPPGDGEQKYVAMRPAFQELMERQKAAVAAVLDGFEGEGELHRWLHRLDKVAHGEVPDDVKRRLATEGAAPTVLLEGGEMEEWKQREARRRIVATVLLPAFNRAARQLQAHASEEDEEETARDPTTA